MAALFFPYYDFVPQGFPGKVLTRQHGTRIQRWCTLFFFAMVLSHWVFLARFLMRHHIWWTAKGEC